MKELIEIQSKLNAPKSQYNSYGKYHYRNCEDVLEALKPLLREQKCYLIIDDDIVDISGRMFVKATVTLYNENSKVSSSAFAELPTERKGMDLAQVTGASSSYARKYALNGLFAIDDNKDPDTQKAPEQKQTSKAEKENLNKVKRDNVVGNVKQVYLSKYKKCNESQIQWLDKEIKQLEFNEYHSIGNFEKKAEFILAQLDKIES